VLGSVLSTEPAKTAETSRAEMPVDTMNRRLSIKSLPEPVLASLRWPGRPELPEGNPAWTYMIDSPVGKFALFIGHVEGETHRAFPFEVWVNGAEQPRGLGRSRRRSPWTCAPTTAPGSR